MMMGYRKNAGIKVTLALFLFLFSTRSVSAGEPVCVVYFTGIGCPHCAKADPALLGELTLEYNSSLVFIEYEVYQERENTQVMEQYVSKQLTSFGIPQVILSPGYYVVGDKPIIDGIHEEINSRLDVGNPCVMLDSTIAFSELDLNTLPGKPKIWVGDKVLVKKSQTTNISNDLIKKVLLSESNIESINDSGRVVEAEDILLSGASIKFNKAIEVDGWILEWNENNVNRIHHPLGSYLEYTIYLVLIVGLMSMAIIHVKEKRGDR